MAWFDEQIRERQRKDEEVFADSFITMAGAVMGSKFAAALNDERTRAITAIDQILHYFHIKNREVPSNITDKSEQLDYLLRPSGIMRRTVTLSKGWRIDAFGPLLAIQADKGTFVPLIPRKTRGYRYLDAETGVWKKITRHNEHLFCGEAISFSKPFPLKSLGIPDLIRAIIQCLSPIDIAIYAISMGAATLVGLLIPKLNSIIFSDQLLSGDMRLFFAVATFFACVTISQLLMQSVTSLVKARIDTKIETTLEAAILMRLLSLPADFFRGYSAGELSSRAGNVHQLCDMLVQSVLTTGMGAVFSLAYITQIFAFAPALTVPALIIIGTTIAFTVVTTLMRLKLQREILEINAKESGMSFALISGIQKIRLAGAEKRVFARWARLYAETARRQYDPPVILKLSPVITSAITLVGALVMYVLAYQSGVTVANYFAFNSAYGMVSGAFSQLAGLALTFSQIKPMMDLVRPLLESVPESTGDDKEILTRVSGNIELSHITFRYNESMPPVLEDLSCKIPAGQYVAIVGRTGCGKSTLLRLLLGFEQPQKGAVYYDGKNIAQVDLRSLRRNIGVVTQNGDLFSSDIYSNIVISAPWLTLNDAWEAAEMAGLADDIRAMPMGMHTMVSEGSGGLSGGQRQRLMIARAVAPKPKILMFDEATSALDNITQKKVSESLDALKCTRIVIAHRLSTIRNCDRILVLDQGRIIEDGSYNELISHNGFFAELVARQRIDENKKEQTDAHKA